MNSGPGTPGPSGSSARKVTAAQFAKRKETKVCYFLTLMILTEGHELTQFVPGFSGRNQEGWCV